MPNDGAWNSLTIDAIAEAIIDYRGKSPKKSNAGIPLVTAKIVKNGRIDPPTEFIPESDYTEWMRRGMPKPGDVVITTEAPLGEVAQLGPEKVALAQRLIVLRAKHNLMANQFLKYALESSPVQHQLHARATGTTVLGIKQSELRQVEIPVPPLPEQRRIAHILGTLDDKIELNRRMNRTLEAIARAIFKSWFIDFDPVHAKTEGREPVGMDAETAALFPDSFQDSPLGKIPEGWEVIDIERFSKLASGKRPTILRDKKTNEAQVPVYGASGVMGYTTATLEARGSIVTGRVGTLGQVHVLDVDAWPSDNTIVVRPKGAAITSYLCRWMERIDLAALNSGSTQPLLTQRALKSLRLLDPGEKLLSSFHQRVSPLRAMQTSGSRQCLSIARLRDCLLPKLLSGQLPEEEVS